MLWFPVSMAALALLCLASGGGGGVAGSRYASYEDMEEQEQEHEQPDRSTSKMLSALFGFNQSPPLPPTESAAAMPHQLQLPAMYYNDFYDDLLATKRNDVHSAGCDCKVTNKLRDLGTRYIPRYLMTAVCESRPAQDAKCTHGSNCRPLEYKVKVLTQGAVPMPVPERAANWLNKETMAAAQLWQFETFTVTAGCFCAKEMMG